MPSRPPALGKHFLVDFSNCRHADMDLESLQNCMLKAAELCGATVVKSEFHRFSPHGLSGVVIIAESHLAVHTWPEYDTICIDLFTCSETMDAAAATTFLAKSFGAAEVVQRMVRRGENLRDIDGDAK